VTAARRARGQKRRAGPDGVVVIDKPRGPTSFSVMRDVQRRLGAGRTGHAGTLDPRATGVLVVLLGEATKISSWVMGHDKIYRATVAFGDATDTLDADGEVVASAPVPPGAVTMERVAAVLPAFVGEVSQIPPAYSAIKRDGRTLMSRARAGEEVPLEPRRVICHGARLLAASGATAEIEVHTGPGYYVRSFARDLGEALGLPAHLAALRRMRSGAFDVGLAVGPDVVTLDDVHPIASALVDVSHVSLTDEEATAVGHGRLVPARDAGDRALLLSPTGAPLALAVRVAQGEAEWWRVQRGFSATTRDPDSKRV